MIFRRTDQDSINLGSTHRSDVLSNFVMEPHRSSVDSVARAYRIPTSQRGLSAENVRSPRWAPAPHQRKRSGDAEKKRGARPLKSAGCLAESVSSRYSNLRWITSDLDRVHAALGGTSAQRPAIQNLRLPPSRRATVASSPRDAALKQLPGRRGGGALRIRSAAWVKISPGHCENAQVRKCDTRSMDLMLWGAHSVLLGTQAGSGPTGAYRCLSSMLDSVRPEKR